MRSEDKAAFLAGLPILSVTLPMSYNGKRTDHSDCLYAAHDGSNEYKWGIHTDTDMFLQISRKDTLIETLENKWGLKGYDPIQSIQYVYDYYVVAEKEGQCYLLYLPARNVDERFGTQVTSDEIDHFLPAEYRQIIRGQVMTAEQAEVVLPAFYEAIEKAFALHPEVSELMGGSDSADDTAKETTSADSSNSTDTTIAEPEAESVGLPNWVLPVVIGGIAVLVGIAVLIAVAIQKRRKA